MKDVISVIMGGGQGKRLFPLTCDRSKPAVPLAGNYRLIDIPISNCLNSHIEKIFVLTQFNSESLNRHISKTYRFDIFSDGFVEILAAEQTQHSSEWYQGTADAVRHNLRHFSALNYKYIVILSGDQLYQMNLRQVIDAHIKNNADITVACTTVDKEAAKGFGLMKINRKGKICSFVEKPTEDEVLNEYCVPDETLIEHKIKPADKNYLASMGIYVFNKETLLEMLDNDFADFGKEIIPNSLKSSDVYSYIFDGYWEDIGTIKSFFNANIELTNLIPSFNFFDSKNPVYTHPRFLPPVKAHNSKLNNVVCSEGSIIENSEINNSIIGIRTVIRTNCKLVNVVSMGADYYDFNYVDMFKKNIPLGIGENSYIENAIIDKNARIGKNVVINNKDKVQDFDGENYFIRDGIVIIPKGATVPDGSII